jgi:hypothetical protein
MANFIPDLRKKNKDRKGCPDPKCVEQTGRNTFVVHTQGKDKFEGKFDPRRFKVINGKMVQVAR